MGVAYEKMFKDDLAIKNFNKAIELDPNFVFPYNGLGNLYYARKKYTQALSYYESAKKLSPNNPIILANLACCQAAAGLNQQALDTFKKAESAAQQDDNLTFSNKGYLNTKLKEFTDTMSKAEAKSQSQIRETNTPIGQAA